MFKRSSAEIIYLNPATPEEVAATPEGTDAQIIRFRRRETMGRVASKTVEAMPAEQMPNAATLRDLNERILDYLIPPEGMSPVDAQTLEIMRTRLLNLAIEKINDGEIAKDVFVAIQDIIRDYYEEKGILPRSERIEELLRNPYPPKEGFSTEYTREDEVDSKADTAQRHLSLVH